MSRVGRRTARVERRSLEDVFIMTGETRAVRSFEIITPQTRNWQLQIKWLAEDGMEVQKGDSLIEFDSANVAQAIEDARLQLTQAEIALSAHGRTLAAESEKKRVAVELAEIEVKKARLDADVPVELRSRREWHEKQSELHEKEAILAKAQQDFTSFTRTSKSETANLRIAVDKASRQLENATRDLGLLAVRAARRGIFIVSPHWQFWVENRKYQVGDMLYPGLTVASIPDLSEMEVKAFLPAVDEGRVAAGQKARCILDTYPDQVFAGRVEDVAAVALDERDRSGFPVLLSLERSDPRLMRPGMSVRVEVVRRRFENALIVPRSAVKWSEDRVRVQRVGGKTKDVRLSACTPTDCVVESGLEEGDRVVS